MFARRARSSQAFAILAAASAIAALLTAGPVLARASLGMYADWGAFSDPGAPRCYAIAKAIPSKLRRDYQPYAAVGTWPRRGVRNQIHFRLSRKMAPRPRLVLQIGGDRFELAGGGGDAWAMDQRMNAAIVAKMRSAKSMTVSATGADGKRFSNSWNLPGAASAMDAAAIGCARVR